MYILLVFTRATTKYYQCIKIKTWKGTFLEEKGKHEFLVQRYGKCRNPKFSLSLMEMQNKQYPSLRASQVALVVKNPPTNEGDDVGSVPGSEKGIVTLSSILARVPWTEEPGGIQSMGSQSQTQLKQPNTYTPPPHNSLPARNSSKLIFSLYHLTT